MQRYNFFAKSVADVRIINYLCSKEVYMKRIVKCLILLLPFVLLGTTAWAYDKKLNDTIALRLSKEFRRYYIDGDEEKLYDKANEISKYIKSQPDGNLQLYYSTLIDVVSFDMNNGHYYRAMRKAKEVMEEMKKNRHTEEYHNGSYMMAVIYWYRNNLPLASKFFEQALNEVPPGNPSVLSTIYTDYANMLTDENPQLAMKLVDKALANSENSYRRTYALSMKGILALNTRDGATVLDCYRQYLDLKSSQEPDQICDIYEPHLTLAAMTVNGRAEEAMREAEELDSSDCHAIQLGICDYIGDKVRGYDILKKIMHEQEEQNNLIMEDDINEMNSDLQVVEANREMARWWMAFLIVLVVLAVIIITSLVVIVINRRNSLRKLRTAYDLLEETTTAKERIESELRIARDIQMSMVPQEFPHREGLDLYAAMEPAREVGGDLYDYLLTDEDPNQEPSLYFCVGDVCGKGVPASLFMAQATRLFHTLALQGMKPAEIVTRINDALSGEDNQQGMFVTMFVGLANLRTGHLDFCNAGHNPPLLGGDADGGDAEGGSFIKMEPNAPVGMWHGLQFKGEEIDSIKGRPLFIYTDGLNEAENLQQERFGDERLLDEFRHIHFEDSHQVIEMLKNSVQKHRNGAEPNDDLTMMCLMIS